MLVHCNWAFSNRLPPLHRSNGEQTTVNWQNICQIKEADVCWWDKTPELFFFLSSSLQVSLCSTRFGSTSTSMLYSLAEAVIKNKVSAAMWKFQGDYQTFVWLSKWFQWWTAQYCVPLHDSTCLGINSGPCSVRGLRGCWGPRSFCHICMTAQTICSFNGVLSDKWCLWASEIPPLKRDEQP